MVTIGDRLLRTREKNGHSRAWVAKKIGCSDTTIRNREQGGGHPGSYQGSHHGWIDRRIDEYLEEFETLKGRQLD